MRQPFQPPDRNTIIHLQRSEGEFARTPQGRRCAVATLALRPEKPVLGMRMWICTEWNPEDKNRRAKRYRLTVKRPMRRAQEETRRE
jgi:hypothetical protein